MDKKSIFPIIRTLQTIFLFIGFTAAEYNNNTNCAHHKSRCDPLSLVPCCQRNNVCRRLGWGAGVNTYYCRLQAKLDDPCQDDFDFFSVKNSICNLNKKCDCDDNYIQVTGQLCKPLLTGTCDTVEDCFPNYSACIDNKCACEIGFLSKSYYRCIPTPLGKSCYSNRDCLPREHMMCSDKICQCRENYIVINGTRCAPLLGAYCWADEQCAVENSSCIDSKCQCIPKFYHQSNDQCVRTILQEPCSNDEDCGSILHAKCGNNHVCECRDFNVVLNEATCSPLLEGYCQSNKNESCFVDNSVCIDSQFQCKPNYVPTSNYNCVKSRLGTYCETDSDCDKVKLSRCSKDNKCICPTNLVSLGQELCLKVLGEACSNDNQCAVKHSFCIDNECRCKKSFNAESEYQCTPEK